MEDWRVIGGVVVGIGGVLLVMVAMAQARDSAFRTRRTARASTGPSVARTALIGLALLAVTLALVLIVLPPFVVWTLATLFWLILGVLFLVD